MSDSEDSDTGHGFELKCRISVEGREFDRTHHDFHPMFALCDAAKAFYSDWSSPSQARTTVSLAMNGCRLAIQLTISGDGGELSFTAIQQLQTHNSADARIENESGVFKNEVDIPWRLQREFGRRSMNLSLSWTWNDLDAEAKTNFLGRPRYLCRPCRILWENRGHRAGLYLASVDTLLTCEVDYPDLVSTFASEPPLPQGPQGWSWVEDLKHWEKEEEATLKYIPFKSITSELERDIKSWETVAVGPNAKLRMPLSRGPHSRAPSPVPTPSPDSSQKKTALRTH
jgi:hypothetical protein